MSEKPTREFELKLTISFMLSLLRVFCVHNIHNLLQFAVNLGNFGAGGGIPMSRKQKFSALRLDFPVKDKNKEESDMDKKFNEIMQRSGRLIINGKVKLE